MPRRSDKSAFARAPEAFLVIPCPHPTPGTIRVNNRLLQVRVCVDCGARTTIPGPCVVCGGRVVAPQHPGPVLPGAPRGELGRLRETLAPTPPKVIEAESNFEPED